MKLIISQANKENVVIIMRESGRGIGVWGQQTVGN